MAVKDENAGRVREAAWNAVSWFESYDIGEADVAEARAAIEELKLALNETFSGTAAPEVNTTAEEGE